MNLKVLFTRCLKPLENREPLLKLPPKNNRRLYNKGPNEDPTYIRTPPPQLPLGGPGYVRILAEGAYGRPQLFFAASHAASEAPA